MPARYVTAPDGTVEYADISVDYTRRDEHSELLRCSPTSTTAWPCPTATEILAAVRRLALEN
ncbi:hypothetical protein [Allomesorhizobium camelthorni]|uniref:hypothetical protein n=1 Tax=Allomesorhizobium camelthorni TaxID=475069 RepID=UPI001FEA7DF4|nr:hypothetical protein [Mesorhizobium camelthorni]